MRTQHLNHKSVASEFLQTATPRDFEPLHLTSKALNEDSCWDEFESDYEDSIPNSMLAFINDIE